MPAWVQARATSSDHEDDGLMFGLDKIDRCLFDAHQNYGPPRKNGKMIPSSSQPKMIFDFVEQKVALREVPADSAILRLLKV